jgi:3-methyladenine DNA glycosylase AlkD
MTFDEVLGQLRSVADASRLPGMARYRINTERAIGVSMPLIRSVARSAGKDHQLALDLWETGIHEARILACLVDRPKWVCEDQMDQWVLGFDSWDLCDQVCSNLFERTPFAVAKAFEWAGRDEEFVRRAGFVLMCALAQKSSKTADDTLATFFPVIARHAGDGRNFVKKALNWALRQIGKKNENLRLQAISVAQEIAKQPTPSARWIARDALRELQLIHPKG